MEFNYNDNVRRTREIRCSRKEQEELVRKEKEAQRLSRSIDKHFDTTYIGALHAVEKMFGPLWANGIPEDQLTEDEYRWRQRWKMVRNEILKNGNDERRAAQAELREYTIERNKHHIDITFNGRNER
jgi:hypothetical protein